MIKAYVVSDKYKTDITGMLVSLDWSGDENTLSRTCSGVIQNANDIDSGNTLINFEVGNMLIAYKDNQEFFRGYIFTKEISSNGSTTFTAYDNLVYMGKSNETMLVKNKLASDVFIQLCKKYGISVGIVHSTGFKIKKKVFTNQTLSDIFTDLLTDTKNNTGKSFKIYSEKGKANLVKRELTTKLTISIDAIISGTNSTSIEETRTQVLVTKGSLDDKDSKFSSVLVKSSSAINKYGVMQHVEEADDNATKSQMTSLANSLLKELSQPTTTASIDFIGDISCITGRIIEIEDKITGIVGRYYISSDSHSFSNGVHKMTLQLSKKLS